MKFKIAEFEIEEIEGIDDKEREQQNSIVDTFDDELLRENIRGILSYGGKHFLKYIIHEVLEENPVYVGEITFSGNKEDEFDIGIEIAEDFRRRGYGYRLLTMLIDRLCKTKRVKKLTYRVMANNIASKNLAEKIGCKLIKEVESPKPLGFTFLIYEIKHFVVDYTFLTKYLPLLKNDEIGGWYKGEKGTFPGVGYTRLVEKFVSDVMLFVDVNEHLGIRDYLGILKDNGVKDIYQEIDSMNEQCLYASLIYFIRQERFCDGLLLSALTKGHIRHILERIEQMHKN